MEYVVGLFDDRPDAERAVEILRARDVHYQECTIRSRENTVRDWLERLFGMEEPQAHMEPHGLPRESSEWLDHQLDRGRVMVEMLVADNGAGAEAALAGAGAGYTRRFRWWPVPEAAPSDE
jgi:hypothetical protein